MEEEYWNDMEDVCVILKMLNKHAHAIKFKYKHDQKGPDGIRPTGMGRIAAGKTFASVVVATDGAAS